MHPNYFLRELYALSDAISDLHHAHPGMQEKDHQLGVRNEDLRQVSEDLAQFAHIALQDLQEPLRKLQQFSGLFKENYDDVLDEDGEYYLNSITKSSQRMSAMIRVTLAYARSSSIGQTKDSVDLQQLVDSLCRDLELLVEESETQICIGALHTVQANRAGIGIDDKYLQRVFMPFERLAGESVRVTGLGLAISHKVCLSHEWKISVSSAEGEGSCFSIVGSLYRTLPGPAM